MVQRRARRDSGQAKRFSVTVDAADYHRLVAFGQSHRPPLTLQFPVEYAIQKLLRDAEDPQFVLPLVAAPRPGAPPPDASR